MDETPRRNRRNICLQITITAFHIEKIMIKQYLQLLMAMPSDRLILRTYLLLAAGERLGGTAESESGETNIQSNIHSYYNYSEMLIGRM